jgi:hypothetical protein
MLALRPPVKGYIIHKYKRRPAERDMTVCAGFLCTDGLIIGADTEFSGGVKWHAQKVRRESFAVGEYVLTGTGNSSFLGMAADVIKCALYGKREEFKGAANTDEQVCIFQSAIYKIIRKLYKEHLRFPAYDGQPIYLDLIIGAHFKGEGEDEQIKLMHCAGDGGACWIDHHIAMGSGGDIAMRFLTMLSPGSLPMTLMTSVAFFCLAEAKLGAEGVGGESHLDEAPSP